MSKWTSKLIYKTEKYWTRENNKLHKKLSKFKYVAELNPYEFISKLKKNLLLVTTPNNNFNFNEKINYMQN